MEKYLWLCHKAPIVVLVHEHLHERNWRIDEHISEFGLASLNDTNSDILILSQARSNDETRRATSTNDVVVVMLEEVLSRGMKGWKVMAIGRAIDAVGRHVVDESS